jgi:hypothetical protein
VAETQKIGVPEYIGEIADSLAVVVAMSLFWGYLKTFRL